jgi:hypothetical protein
MSTKQRLLAGLLCLTASLLLSVAGVARADTIPAKSADLILEDETYVLNAQFDVAFNSTLEEALQKGISLYFDSLDEVEHLLSRVVSRPVIARDALVKGARYDAAVRLRLDVTQLSKPFQINALASRDWSLESEWYRWSFTP